MSRYVVAIDQGTTGTTVLVLDEAGRVRGRAYREFSQFYPRPGWVEHDPEEIWTTTIGTVRRALRAAKVAAKQVAAVGITNQRETAVVWDRRTGRPLHRAIVWQDRRTAPRCDELRSRGVAGEIRKRTGLVLDPYFSATKIEWLLAHLPERRRRNVAVGTIDSWLVWKLTNGAAHLTDFTNASRTMLFHLEKREWDPFLLELFGVPSEALPALVPSAGVAATTARAVFGAEVPIAGIAGDQQAALFGQACVQAGMVKNTYGTGCFLLMHTGAAPVYSRRGLLTTVACGPAGEPAYAMEGSVFIAGAAIQWLRDGLGLIRDAKESERLARQVESTLGVYFVPAFVGLGAPYWDPAARGAIVGLTRGVTKAHLVRAALEALAYQTRDVVETMVADSGQPLKLLRVDGGAAANDFLLQFQADMLAVPVDRPALVETTAQGAAFLAGLGVGLWKPSQLERLRRRDRLFRPRMAGEQRELLYQGWRRAVAAVRSLGS
ncbi:MAG: glycerol kinase GlpK [Candidatus Binatia bacterium]|nr:glycerol kinase GlpK [Candidatus Binatia bacterium]